MKSVILYGSPVKSSRHHYPVHAYNQPEFFVRMKVVDGDALTALDLAGKDIREGETVLNTVELPEADHA